MRFLHRLYAPMLSGRLYLEAAYFLLGLAFGLLWAILFITLYAVGVGTAIVWVGVPILVGTHALLRPVGAIERAQVRWLLHRDVAAPVPLPGSVTRRQRSQCTAIAPKRPLLGPTDLHLATDVIR